MIEASMYDQFGKHYDRFVDWESRLSAELPFLFSIFRENLAGPPQNNSILDAACGTGQHAIALSKAGFNCSGADISQEMVAVARTNALQAGSAATFQQAGFGQMTQRFGESQFDGLICLGNSLPHLLDETSLANALSDFRTVLKPGGLMILQNRNFDLVLSERSRWMPPQSFSEGENLWVFARFYDFNPDGRLTFNIQILHRQGQGVFDQQVISTRLWPMEKALLANHVNQSGFSSLRFFGNLAGDPFEASESGNLVITAKLPQ